MQRKYRKYEEKITSDTLGGSRAHQKNPCTTCCCAAFLFFFFFSVGLKDITSQWDLSTGLCPWQDSTQQLVPGDTSGRHFLSNWDRPHVRDVWLKGTQPKQREPERHESISLKKKDHGTESTWCPHDQKEGLIYELWDLWDYFCLSKAQCPDLSFPHNLCFAVWLMIPWPGGALAQAVTSTLQPRCW